MAENNFSKYSLGSLSSSEKMLYGLIQKQKTAEYAEERTGFFQLLQKAFVQKEAQWTTFPNTASNTSLDPNSSLLEALCKVESPSPSDTMVSPSRPSNSLLSPPKSSELKAKRSDPDRYKVLETFPSLGAEITQHVQDQFLNRKVNLKKVLLNASEGSPSFLTQQKMLEQMRKEARITSILEHPNIVPLYDFIEREGEEIYFTTRTLVGKSLREILIEERGSNKSDETHVLSIYLKVCDAIRYAHSRGFIHRNLKPESIFVGSFGEVYVTHWNFAKNLHDPEADSQVCSTAFALEDQKTGYASPEQLQDRNSADQTADIYSLGKILRTCFTLLSPAEEQALLPTPISEKTDEKCFLAQLCDPLEKKVPQEIRAIIKKATQEKPLDRYRSVENLVLDIERYQQKICILVREHGPVEAILKWIRHKRKK